jgi:hypothetical protein
MLLQALRCRSCVFAVVLAISIFICICACSNSSRTRSVITESSDVIVEPGRGVTNVCEVGMNFAQIKRATQDATLHTLRHRSDSRCVLVPGLGATANLDDNGNVQLILFHPVPFDSSGTAPGLLVTNPFRGRLGAQLSFKNGRIGRNQIESAFGGIQQNLTNSPMTITRISVDSIKKGEPVSFRCGNKEEIGYPRLGLGFVLEGDVVTSFGVSKPEKPDESRRIQ